MMTRSLVCWLVCSMFAISAAHAQQLSHPLTLDGGDSFFHPSAQRLVVTPHDTLRILAVMVQFQNDSDSRTTGSGSFDLSLGSDTLFDAPPHDTQYFAHHLQFAENYYQKVSDGKCIIRSTVIPQVFTLSKKMQTYAPLLTGTDYTPLARLMIDAWRTADSLLPEIDFSRYNAFVIFHAGAGRDFNLADQGNPLPYDLPSLYLNHRSLQKIYGDAYEGITVDSGRTFITSSIILPETERLIIGEGVFESSIDYSWNGLLAAMIGSHLGLPDLYNTATGQSGIGQFGLMDGAGFFSYRGLFPPEPSAWERITLGWAKPVELPSGISDIRIPAVGLHNGSDSIIYKIPINSREYYLIENRNRDPLKNGQVLTMMVDGQPVTRHFNGDTTDIEVFNENNPEAVRGVLVDVEDYDWSLPGGVDTSNSIYDGGILIWHIDENIINARSSSNSINNDPQRRGVDLEEADGSQDIGQSYGLLDAAGGSEYGTLFDYWYEGNKAPLYLNRFDETTHPPALTNSGFPTHIRFDGFTQRGPDMGIRIRIGDDLVQPLSGFPKKIGAVKPNQSAVALFGTSDVEPIIFAPSSKGLYGFRLFAGSQTGSDTRGWVCDTTGLILEQQSPISNITLVPPDPGYGNKQSFVCLDSSIGILFTRGEGECCSIQSVTNPRRTEADVVIPPTAILGMRRIQAPPAFLIGYEFGGIMGTDFSGQFLQSRSVSTLPIIAFLGPGTNDTLWTAVAEDGATTSTGITIPTPDRKIVAAAAGDINGDGKQEMVFVTSSGTILIYSYSGEQISHFSMTVSDSIVTSPAIADIDHDGKNDIIMTVGNTLMVMNYGGASVEYFPVRFPSGGPITASPVVGDIDGDGSIDIIVGLANGNVAAVNSHGKMVPGFPLATGGAVVTTPFLFNVLGKIGLTVSCADSVLYGWQFSTHYVDSLIPWPAYHRDAAQSNMLAAISGATVTSGSGFFPKSRAYNWPNPVYDGKTYIRYYLGAAASVTIRVYDIAGDKVAEFPGPGTGGIDNEVEWNTSSLQPGIYLAKIEARGSTGSGDVFIKIAVVK
jgi:hypothetical protein